MPESTTSPTPPQETETPQRTTRFSPLKLLGIAIGAHVVVVLLLSPSFFTGGEDTSPEALLRKARELREKEEYQAALETYQRVVQQKPTVPAIFTEAEKEMHQTRLQALEKERQLAEKAKAAAKAEEEKQPGAGEDQPGTGEDGQPGTGEQPPPPEDTDVPALPDIEDSL